MSAPLLSFPLLNTGSTVLHLVLVVLLRLFYNVRYVFTGACEPKEAHFVQLSLLLYFMFEKIVSKQIVITVESPYHSCLELGTL